MSAVLAFTAPIHRPVEPEYIDEPCSEAGNVRGSHQINNVTYVNFLPAAEPKTRLRITKRGRRVLTAAVALPLVIGALVAALNSGGAAAVAEGASNDFTYVTSLRVKASGSSLRRSHRTQILATSLLRLSPSTSSTEKSRLVRRLRFQPGTKPSIPFPMNAGPFGGRHLCVCYARKLVV